MCSVNANYNSTLFAYLIGVDIANIQIKYEHTADPSIALKLIEKNKDALLIRTLCQIRTQLMRFDTTIDKMFKFDLKNIDTIPDYVSKEWLDILNDFNVDLWHANYTCQKYVLDINNLLNKHIDFVSGLFADWINFKYIRKLIVSVVTASQYSKKLICYHNYINWYPYKCFIDWEPKDMNYLCRNDRIFVKELYAQFGETFADSDKFYTLTEDDTSSMFDYIRDNECTILVDCENADVFKLIGLISALPENYLPRIKEVVLVDGVYTHSVWNLLSKYISIPVRIVSTRRVSGRKSLVDMTLAVEACRLFYTDNRSSFILMSSDSDFYGLMATLPEANFMVLYEYQKCGNAILEVMEKDNIPHFSIDSYEDTEAAKLKYKLFRDELEKRLDSIRNVNAYSLIDSIISDLRISFNEEERKRLCAKYVSKIAVEIDEEYVIRIIIKD